jgi:indole-3-glycerol phosphate synthase
MSVLETILATTRTQIARLRATPMRSIERSPIDVFSRVKRDRDDPLRLIAEIKNRSPSAGALSRVLSVADRARVYERCGASMISVLVDGAHFDGSYEDLAAARAAVEAPILCKGFVLDEVQVDAAQASGADAVLLIVRILDDASLVRLAASVRAKKMTPIVEVVDERELVRAIAAGANVIGVNARDLDTLSMDAARASRVVSRIPESIVALFFSGIGSADEVARIARENPGDRRIDGALVGEALMRRDDPASLLQQMVAAARPARLESG